MIRVRPEPDAGLVDPTAIAWHGVSIMAATYPKKEPA
jgi:hypothetical protein